MECAGRMRELINHTSLTSKMFKMDSDITILIHEDPVKSSLG